MVSLPYPQLDGHNPYSPGRASFMPESVRIDLGHNLPSLPWERGQRVTASPQNESPGSFWTVIKRGKKILRPVHMLSSHWPGSLWSSWAGSSLQGQAKWYSVHPQWQNFPGPMPADLSSLHSSLARSEASCTLLCTSLQPSLSVKWGWSPLSCHRSPPGTERKTKGHEPQFLKGFGLFTEVITE